MAENINENVEVATEVASTEPARAPERRQRGTGNNNGGRRDNRGRRDDRRNNEEKDNFESKVVDIRRVTKVVKGGRNMRFSALVVCGDSAGKVGVGVGKAGEVSGAIEKATQAAKRNLTTVPIVGTSIPHEIRGKFAKSDVLMLPAEEGTGVIAGGPVRAVLELAGVKDIRTKSYCNNNPVNCVRATIQGLQSLRTAETIAALRGKTVEEILG